MLVTEIKTTTSLDQKTETSTYHRAQVHAYLYGLSEKYDRTADEAVVIYGDRESMTVKAFSEPFDPEFWNEVLEWASRHTQYRENEELPPGSPEQDWECKFCSYRHRCGKTDKPFSDVGIVSFLPLMNEYPREQAIAYLEAHSEEEAMLTPTLAETYPDLAMKYTVASWMYSRCESEFDWDAID